MEESVEIKNCIASLAALERTALLLRNSSSDSIRVLGKIVFALRDEVITIHMVIW